MLEKARIYIDYIDICTGERSQSVEELKLAECCSILKKCSFRILMPNT